MVYYTRAAIKERICLSLHFLWEMRGAFEQNSAADGDNKHSKPNANETSFVTNVGLKNTKSFLDLS